MPFFIGPDKIKIVRLRRAASNFACLRSQTNSTTEFSAFRLTAGRQTCSRNGQYSRKKPPLKVLCRISPRFEDDTVTEFFQALDQSLLEVMLVQAVEVVQAEILVGLAGYGERVYSDEQAVGDGDQRAILSAHACQ